MSDLIKKILCYFECCELSIWTVVAKYTGKVLDVCHSVVKLETSEGIVYIVMSNITKIGSTEDIPDEKIKHLIRRLLKDNFEVSPRNCTENDTKFVFNNLKNFAPPQDEVVAFIQANRALMFKVENIIRSFDDITLLSGENLSSKFIIIVNKYVTTIVIKGE